MNKKIESAVHHISKEYLKAYFKFSVIENYSELFEKEIYKELKLTAQKLHSDSYLLKMNIQIGLVTLLLFL